MKPNTTTRAVVLYKPIKFQTLRRLVTALNEIFIKRRIVYIAFCGLFVLFFLTGAYKAYTSTQFSALAYENAYEYFHTQIFSFTDLIIKAVFPLFLLIISYISGYSVFGMPVSVLIICRYAFFAGSSCFVYGDTLLMKLPVITVCTVTAFMLFIICTESFFISKSSCKGLSFLSKKLCVLKYTIVFAVCFSVICAMAYLC